MCIIPRPIYMSGFLKYIQIVIPVLFLILQSCKKNPENSVPTGVITGVVSSNSGIPLSRVKVSINNQRQSYVYTDANGRYTHGGIAAGDYTLLAAKEHFLSESKTAVVKQDDITKIDFTLEAGEPVLEVEKQTYEYSYTRINDLINIRSNAGWTISSSEDWLKVEKLVGVGDSPINIRADENLADAERSAKLTIMAGTEVKEVMVTQYPKLSLLGASMTHPLSDTVILKFSAPVTEIQISAKYNLCAGILTYNQNPMSKEVRMRYSCGTMGRSYPFEVVAKNKTTSLTENLDVNFFSEQIKFQSFSFTGLSTYFVTDDNKFVWFSMFDSKVVHKIDIETFKVTNNYSFDFNVRKLVYNPYNKLIYILTNTPDIYIMDPGNGSLVKRVTLESLDGPDDIYPTIYPRTLSFTRSGIGAMVCEAQHSSGTSWKMIDSRNNNLVYYHKEKDKSFEYGKIEVNHDRTKLFIKAAFTNTLFSLDPVKDEITDIAIPVHGALGHVIPNKKSDNLYFIQTYEQYIYNPVSSYLSKASYLAHGNAGDFSYLPGEEEIIYAFDTDNRFLVLDYKNQKTLLTFPTINELYYGKPISTTDGKYLINFTNSTLFRFDTGLFSVGKKVNPSSNFAKSAFKK